MWNSLEGGGERMRGEEVEDSEKGGGEDGERGCEGEDEERKLKERPKHGV